MTTPGSYALPYNGEAPPPMQMMEMLYGHAEQRPDQLALIYADERIVGTRIAMGAGEHGLSAWVDADDLIRGLGATVADIS